VIHFSRIMTRRFLSLCLLAAAGGLAVFAVRAADATNPAPDFKEVYDLLRANLPGATDAALNRAAVAGLLSQFPGQVTLVGGGSGGGAESLAGGTALVRSVVIESNVADLRISRVVAGLPGELAAASRALIQSNKVAGVILDLRFAGGEDYGAAREAAGFLTDKASPRPLVILVNGKTQGAAETLAATLRAAEAGLVIGSQTAGGAMTFKEFPLKDGERLLVAVAPPKTDAHAAPADGLKPDIAVAVNSEDERAFWQNPYVSPASGTNVAKAAANGYLPPVDRTSEADLVRQQQKDGKLLNLPVPAKATPGPARDHHDEGDNPDDVGSARLALAPRPVLRDPVLTRAVDLIKCLAVLHGVHP